LNLPRGPRIELEFSSVSLAILTLRGEHDLNTAPEISDKLTAASAHRNVLVDLSRCTFIDSTVISALLRASNSMHSGDCLLSLVIPNDRHHAILRVFEIMSIERALPIYETRAGAITQLDAPQTSHSPRTRLRAISEIIDASLLDADPLEREQRDAA
jgi:anti-anti-sigma factor